MNNPISKKVVFGFIGVVLVSFIIFFAAMFPKYARLTLVGNDSNNIVREYDKENQIELFGDNDAYEMGLNADDRPVFKDKWKALSQLKKDCPRGIKTIKKENGLLLNLSIFYWDWYCSYSFRTYDVEDKAIQKELKKIHYFFSVYQNSFLEPQATTFS